MPIDPRPHADRPPPFAGKLYQRDGIPLDRTALVVNREVGFRQMLEYDELPKVYGGKNANDDHAVQVLSPVFPR